MAVVILTLRRALIVGVLALAACRKPANVAPSPSAPQQTVDQFLAAVNANDLDRMAMLWGDARGPSSVVRINSDSTRTQQLMIFQRLLRSDSHDITGTDLSTPSRPKLSVALTQGTRHFTVPFTLVQSRYGGWLIVEMDLTPAMPQSGSSPNRG